MLTEEQRVIKPAHVAGLIPWDKIEACIVMCKGKHGGLNNVVMSSMSIEELSLLTAQLQAHLTGLLVGSINEGLPGEGKADASANS